MFGRLLALTLLGVVLAFLTSPAYAKSDYCTVGIGQKFPSETHKKQVEGIIAQKLGVKEAEADDFGSLTGTWTMVTGYTNLGKDSSMADKSYNIFEGDPLTSKLLATWKMPYMVRNSIARGWIRYAIPGVPESVVKCFGEAATGQPLYATHTHCSIEGSEVSFGSRHMDRYRAALVKRYGIDPIEIARIGDLPGKWTFLIGITKASDLRQPGDNIVYVFDGPPLTGKLLATLNQADLVENKEARAWAHKNIPGITDDAAGCFAETFGQPDEETYPDCTAGRYLPDGPHKDQVEAAVKMHATTDDLVVFLMGSLSGKWTLVEATLYANANTYGIEMAYIFDGDPANGKLVGEWQKFESNTNAQARAWALEGIPGFTKQAAACFAQAVAGPP